MENTRTVTIMYRGSWFDPQDWTRYPVTVEIGATCPACGGPRGEPTGYNFCDDDEWLHVNVWQNECGHVDHYQDVYEEAKRLKEQP